VIHNFRSYLYLEEIGAPVIMEGRIGESIRFFYVDAQPTLKVIMESGSGHAVDMTRYGSIRRRPEQRRNSQALFG
jgi:hypothetical protein